MDNCHFKTVLDFMVAAQTLTAIYGSPDGPTDPERYYEMMTSLLDDPQLLHAQVVLAREQAHIVLAASNLFVLPEPLPASLS